MPEAGKDLGHSGIRLGRGSTLGLADIRIENGMVRAYIRHLLL